MPVSTSRLTEIGERFVGSMNDRDYASAAALYAERATYESASLVNKDNEYGRLVGRDQIMAFFMRALVGHDDFQLSIVECLAGMNLTVVVSSFGGRAFVDVLRVDDEGLIVEHLEVEPKASSLGSLIDAPKP